MTFIWPGMLLTLLLLPLAAWFYGRQRRQQRQAAAVLGTLGLLQDGGGRPPGRRVHLPAWLFLLGLALLLISLSRPEMEIALPRVEGTVILAFDISSSMTATDLEPSRIEAARAAARAFVADQPATVRIGVVAFSNGGVVVQPPTDDQAAVLATVDRLSPQGGTSLGQGIFTALSAIAGEAITIDENALAADGPPVDIGTYPSAIVVLLSDGENTGAPEPEVIAQLAATAGVRVFPIGIGSPEGEVLEIDGYQVLTQLNEVTLREIADLTNGAYFHASDAAALEEIYDNIAVQLTIAGEKMEVTALLAGASLLLLLAGGLLSMAWFGRVP